MTTVKAKDNVNNSQLIKGKKYSCDNLGDIAADYFNNIDVLSLDCFDTILWRHVETPTDVFYDFHDHPDFIENGITAQLRIMLEANARMRKFVTHGTTEVTLVDIYRAISHDLSDEIIDRMIKAEFEAEKKYCFGYRPIIDLMYAAISRGKKLIIVSDTYFTEQQVRELLRINLPEKVMSAISRIFISNEHNAGKSNGLHHIASSQLGVLPSKILHVGDNEIADFISPEKSGMFSAQILQFSESVENQMRMRTMGLMLMRNEVRCTEPLYDPYRMVFSKRWQGSDRPQQTLGYHTLGPIYYSFACYLHDEIARLSQQHKNIKVLYLLRDGHLPKKAFDAVYPDVRTYAVRISRFVATAASFTTKESIEKYLSETVFSGRYKDVARQLLLSDDAIERLLKQIESSSDMRGEFIKRMLSDKTVGYIISQSKLYLKRLMLYLKRSANVSPGDTLLFVDLGYSGSAQSKLAPVFKSEYDITILGRYLISLSTPGWRASRAGLLDPDHCDDNLLLTLVNYVALLEQLSTTTDRSVVDFAEDGEPIYGEASLNEDQYEKLTLIQEECELFARDVCTILTDKSFASRPEVLRQVAIGALTRLLYFPTQDELNYLNTFKFDLNLGTNDILEMFDANKGIDALRRRGMFFMERNSKTMRTNYPAELRVQSLPLLITLLSQHRHGFQYNLEDISYISESIPVYVVSEHGNAAHTIKTNSTHDGFHSLIIPLGKGQYAVAIAFGQVYDWVDIYSYEMIPLSSLNSHFESIYAIDVKDKIVLDKMEFHGDGLYHCLSAESIALYNAEPAERQMILRVVFRPIVKKNK